MTGAFSDVRVLEVAGYTAGPLTGEFLAQLGAQVTKVEPPWGEQTRTFAYRVGDDPFIFHINNAGKRCVTADVKRPAGRDLVLQLAGNADVFLENFAPGALDRCGLGYDDVNEVAPEIIYCSLNGFGSSGPMAGKRAYDSVIQGLAGLVSLTGPSEVPVKVGPSAADISSAVACAAALAAAIYHQQRTGRGQRVEVAMFDVVAWLTQRVWAYRLAGVDPPPRDGNRDFVGAPQNLFEAGDGPLVIAVETDTQWRALAALIERPEWVTDERLNSAPLRRAAQDEIDTAIRAWIGDQHRDEVVQACQTRGVPAAPVLSLEDVVAHPQLEVRSMFVELPDASGEHVLRLPNSTYRMSVSDGRVERSAERLGASNRYVYGNLGHSDEDLAAWTREGVI
jgi:crotonobetainyl-CoA:carnitine CoA-transferase CaiB-like acyl-CoA transferase